MSRAFCARSRFASSAGQKNSHCHVARERSVACPAHVPERRSELPPVSMGCLSNRAVVAGWIANGGWAAGKPNIPGGKTPEE